MECDDGRFKTFSGRESTRMLWSSGHKLLTPIQFVRMGVSCKNSDQLLGRRNMKNMFKYAVT